MSELRQACDRCHDKKLRCPKSAYELSCTRCTKASVPCVFSPPTRPTRSTVYDHEMAYDWPLTMEPAFDMQQPACTSQGISDCLPSSLPATSSAPIADDAERSEAAQLADMLVCLDGIWRRLTNPGFLHHVPRQNLTEYVDGMGSALGIRPALELLSNQAQQLVVLYPRVCELATEGLASSAEREQCSISDCIHMDVQLHRSATRHMIDHALLHLLLSCHLRLLDVFGSLAARGRMCTKMVAVLPPDYEARLDVPEVRVGAFTAPQNAAASMLVSILFELHHRLTAKNRELAQMKYLNDLDPADEAKLIRLQCEVVQSRARLSLAELEPLKQDLIKAGIMA